MKNIIGKTAYWGRHTFEATKHNKGIQLTIFRNCPKKLETIYRFNSVEDLINDSKEPMVNLYIGSLDGTRYVDNVEVKTIDYFLSCFKHKTK